MPYLSLGSSLGFPGEAYSDTLLITTVRGSMSLSRWIRGRRKALGLNQAEPSTCLGLNQMQVSQWESLRMRVQDVDSSANHNASTTMIYAHVLKQGGKGAQSPIDKLLSAILQNLQCWR